MSHWDLKRELIETLVEGIVAHTDEVGG